ncbi:MAG: glycosyltransferase [Proteobacteria bacterium]|nr:glycosyltransferase [Pseudomonadota bacterium]
MKSRHTILHVIDSLDLGGAQSVLINLIRHGDRSRFNYEVATMHGHGVYWDAVRELGIPVHSLSVHPLLPSYVPALLWLCASRRYDIVHAHLLGSNLIAKPLAALCRVKVRINHDHCNDKTGMNRWLVRADKLVNRLSTHVIAVSGSVRDYAICHEGLPADRVDTVYNGIDLARFQPGPEKRTEARARFGLPQDAFVVIGVGRLSYQKNFGLFLQVAARVLKDRPQAYFAIAGTGDEEAALRQQARELGLEPRLKFLGFVADMRALYPAADVLMLTSRYEGLPITILEAMATGTAIVSSNLDGVQEVLRDDVDSALVTPGDAEGFAQRLRALMDSPQLMQRYRQAALTKVRTTFSAEAATRAVESIYLRYLQDAAASPSPAAPGDDPDSATLDPMAER